MLALHETLTPSLSLSLRGSLCGLCLLFTLPLEVLAEGDVEELVVLGTRAQPRSVLDSTVPIDVIDSERLQEQGSGDLNFMLRTLIPSFSVNTQPGRDAAALQNPINLRGLAPDHTLILLNGKRRHRGATITWISDGRADGSQGPDISAIPAIALKRVEVLRDGAAAQYGSDAIAGVINFELRDDSEGATLEYQHGWFDADGGEDKDRVSGNIGLPLTDYGFANFGFEYSSDSPTSRSDLRSDVARMQEAGNAYIANPAHVWGSPDIDDNFKSVFNLGIDMDAERRLYAFGNYASREVETGFFYREPEDESGVFVTGDLPLIYAVGNADCSRFNVALDAGGLPPDLAGLRADSDCFTFHEWFPGGFQPRFGGDITDFSVVAGFEGALGNGLSYDLSISHGENEAEYFIHNTINPSWGPDSPTSFDLGAYIQTETNFNLDLAYQKDVGLASELSIAGGFEWREEEFEIELGEEASWREGTYAGNGSRNGANGFGGFSPTAAGKWDRENIAVYLDLEADVLPDWTVGGAVRWEDFDDFGTTTEAKLSTRVQATDRLALRASIGSGFRAPTPGQQNAYNVSTIFDPATGELNETGTIPSDSELAAQFGGRSLEPEESDSVTLGAIFEIGALNFTVDYFRTEVDDRIFLSDFVDLTNVDANGNIIGYEHISSEDIAALTDTFTRVRYFENDFDTETDGIDVVMTYEHSSEWGETDVLLSYNRTETEVTRSSNLSERRKRWIEEGIPETRFNAIVNHSFADWKVLLRYNHFGDWYSDYDSSNGPVHYSGYGLTDIAVTRKFSGLSLTIGSDNILDQHPDRSVGAASRGNRYPRFAPGGINGRFLYLRARYEF